MALTKKRQVFIEEYLRCWNGAEAARRAGYKHPRHQASYLLTIPNVQKAIEARIAEKAMSADEVLLRLTEQGRSEQTAYLKTNGTIDLEKLIKDGKAHLIKGTRWDRSGNLIIEFYDAQSALVHLGKHLELFKDRLQVEGSLELKDADPKDKLLGRLGSIAARESETGGGQQPD